MSKLLRPLSLVLCLVLTLGTVFVSRAQDGYAAVVTVYHAGVELKRVNTESWLALPQDAQAPIGAGDVLRTDANGRAYVLFAPAIEILLLPDSALTVGNFAGSDETGTDLSISINGQMIQRTDSDSPINTYALESPYFTLTQPAPFFSAWGREPAEGTGDIIVTVAEGEAQGVMANDVIVSIPAESGLRASSADEPEMSALDYPYNGARLVGLLDGCPGDVETREGLNLNVRVGPGFQATVIGNLPTDAETRIMGISESGNWYRIQALTGFAWVRSNLVSGECENVPVLPNSSAENNPQVSQVRPEELEFMIPFFDIPEENLWFYRSVLSS